MTREGRVKLTALRLGNFKAFGPTQRVVLKPLTFVYGPNSAGKSSLIHSLALAHEACRCGNLDSFRTDVGGTSIDLGGFRQYVFRRDSSRRVEWAAEIDATKISGRLGELLAPVGTVGITVNFGLPVDDRGYAPSDALTELISYKVEGDSSDLLRMSKRPEGTFRLDYLACDHPVFRHALKTIDESRTTSEFKKADQLMLEEAIAELVPTLKAKVGRFLPSGIKSSFDQVESGEDDTIVFSASRESGSQDLVEAVRFCLLHILNELIRGLDLVVGSEIDRFNYLGPLRSYPPRHLAFSEHDDSNWQAGGGYAWDVLRRNRSVRKKVNEWLGAKWLRTNYKLVVRELVAIEQLEKPLASAFETFEFDEQILGLEVDYDDATGQPFLQYPVIKDFDEAISRIQDSIEKSDIEMLPELILIDQRTDTVVSHRDVGIGISQVLPVLVSCYGLRDQIISIEQPEIHLHPALQAELGDVFIRSALGEQQNLFILESHSEHLILRVLRRIRETTDKELPADATPVTPNDVAVLYVEPAPAGAQVVEIPVTEDGEFGRPWPQGFFAERVKELF